MTDDRDDWIAQFQKENAELIGRLKKAETIIGFQKSVGVAGNCATEEGKDRLASRSVDKHVSVHLDAHRTVGSPLPTRILLRLYCFAWSNPSPGPSPQSEPLLRRRRNAEGTSGTQH